MARSQGGQGFYRAKTALAEFARVHSVRVLNLSRLWIQSDTYCRYTNEKRTANSGRSSHVWLSCASIRSISRSLACSISFAA